MRRQGTCSLEELEPRIVLSPIAATEIIPGTVVPGFISPQEVDYYSFRVSEPGWLTVRVLPPPGSTLDSRVALYNSDSPVLLDGLRVGGGGLLVVSDDAHHGDANPAIDQILDEGTFYLTVSAGGAGTSTGEYALVTVFTPLPPEMRDQLPNLNPEAHAGIRGDLTALATGDFNRDNISDLAVADRGQGLVWVLLGLGETNFAPPVRYKLPGQIDALEVQDFNSDGRADFAVLDRTAGTVTIVVGFGDGTFSLSTRQQLPASHPAFTGLFAPGGGQMVGVDINRDGFTDRAALLPSAAGDVVLSLAVRIPAESDAVIEVPWAPQPIAVQPFLGNNPLFVSANDALFDEEITLNPARTPPLIADFDGDGIDDLVTVNQAGDILFRPGIVGVAQIVNQADAPRSRVVTVIHGGPRPRLAALDLLSSSVSLYHWEPTGHWVRTPGPTTGLSPYALAAGDLNGDGLSDLVVANSLFSLASLSLYLGQPDGSFRPVNEQHTTNIKVGSSVSHLLLKDVNQDGRRDVLLSNAVAGDVSVLLNRTADHGALQFEEEDRYRAGTLLPGETGPKSGLYLALPSAVATLGNSLFESQNIPFRLPNLYLVGSAHAPVAVISADFTGDKVDDILVVNRGSNTITLLVGKPDSQGRPTGRFADPRVVAVADRPGATVIGDFNTDGNLDLAVLMHHRAEVWVYLGKGDGTFACNEHPVFAGTSPTGMILVVNPETGQRDLLITNPFGDVLRLEGQGNGTFQPASSFAGNRTTLHILRREGNGQIRVLVGNQKTNRVKIQAPRKPGQFRVFATLPKGNNPLPLAPGSVLWVKLDGPRDRYHDAVVVGSGNNSVLVYRNAENNPRVKPVSFPVGTNPVHISVAHLNGDDIPDLVVTNQGSNDVSILFGSLDGRAWTTTGGPRISSGGVGPTATLLRDTDGDGRLDLFISNHQDQPSSARGNVAVVPGRGLGFFDDGAVRTSIIPPTREPPLLIRDVLIVRTSSGRLIGFDPVTLTSRGPVFGGTVNAVGTFGNRLVVALEGGSVNILNRDGDRFTLGDRLYNLTGLLPSEPSALEVLQNADGSWMVLLTAAGSDELFVFAPRETPETASVPTATLVLDATELEGAPLAAVVTLLAGALPESDTTVSDAPEVSRPGYQVGGTDEEEETEESDAAEAVPENEGDAQEAQKSLSTRPPEVDPFAQPSAPPEEDNDTDKPEAEEADEEPQEDLFTAAVRLLWAEQTVEEADGQVPVEQEARAESEEDAMGWVRELKAGVLVGLAGLGLELSWRVAELSSRSRLPRSRSRPGML